MGEIEEGREAHLLADLILACLLNMEEIEEGREAHLHTVLILAWPPFVTGGGGGGGGGHKKPLSGVWACLVFFKKNSYPPWLFKSLFFK
jgi:hypothetical protein